jgi:hypothetical protein
MQDGVYRKIQVSGRGKGGGIGELYQYNGIHREHFTGEEYVSYIPLRIESEWAGTVRRCIIKRKDFEKMFEFVGEGLPK